jgi:hypothetical protein
MLSGENDYSNTSFHGQMKCVKTEIWSCYIEVTELYGERNITFLIDDYHGRKPDIQNVHIINPGIIGSVKTGELNGILKIQNILITIMKSDEIV